MNGPFTGEKAEGAEGKAAPVAGDPVFASTGPKGHRQRMRQRVLERGAASLADYEILEMLLFPGVPRRDTKPQAKALINHFGSLAAVLEAPADALRQQGVGPASARLLTLMPGVAHCMAIPKEQARLTLGSWDALLEYCDEHYATLPAGQMRVLFLDSRNQLLSDEEVRAADEAPVFQQGASKAQTAKAKAEALRKAVAFLLQRALSLHASALITIRLTPAAMGLDHQMGMDAPLIQMVLKEAPLLAVDVHDHLVLKNGEWRSFRLVGQEW
ncbi:JAB domain-containing protein [Acetobacter tropicalis]|uniref:DNA repair protein RadC n=1 Tax=Acetobacter tropicalis TaxID=104102 RepID=A0A252ABE2_9PROT|nr:JAB domain-containing protein [Acetobacter tropicalis]OUI86901.1 DNA repair protein RadC [Acetobacter tropicalis]